MGVDVCSRMVANTTARTVLKIIEIRIANSDVPYCSPTEVKARISSAMR